jgi:hypothetical protein
MAQVNEEHALRALLTEMTADQPPAPQARYAAVRRRAVAYRRRQLATATAIAAVLVAAAIAIPLGLLHRQAQPPPIAPGHRYHMSERMPGLGSPHDLIASGVLSGIRYQATAQIIGSQMCVGVNGSSACSGPVPVAWRTGAPLTAEGGTGPGFTFFTARSDVTALTVTYDTGQTLSLRPVSVFGDGTARFIVVIAPRSSAVTRVTAYSAAGEVGYTVPFTADGEITISRWLRAGAPALPRPVTAVLGSGTVHGSFWREHVYVGPWGTCFGTVGGASFCFPSTGWLPPRPGLVHAIGFSAFESAYQVYYGQAQPSVRYLVVTTRTGVSAKVWAVAAEGRRFFAFPSVASDPVVRWAAYDRSGQELASGTSQELAAGTGP